MKVENIDPTKIDFGVGFLKGAASNHAARETIEAAIEHIQHAAKLVRRAQRERSKVSKKLKPFPREATIALAQCVITVLNTGGKLGIGTGIIAVRDPKSKKLTLKSWADDLFDALEMIGVEYDREGYYASLKPRRKRPSKL